ncbi:DNA replication checkpoint protein tel2 [Erysiphe necator]|nr:DNA replication checkpoint protein tel2 [Erysiphe necator]
MDGHLTQVSTYKRTEKKSNGHQESKSKSSEICLSITTAKEALKFLQNEPNYQDLISILRYICQQNSDIDICSPSPLSAQLVHVLVSDIVPSFWNILSGSDFQSCLKIKPELRLLISCLQNIASLNSIILRLKQYIQLSKTSNNVIGQGPSIQEYLKIYLDLLGVLLSDDGLIEKIWRNSIKNLENPLEQRGIWKEILVKFSNGEIIGICAEAEDLFKNLSKNFNQKCWLSCGRQYSHWLARNILFWARNVPKTSEIDLKCCADLFGKSLSLGYPDFIVQEIVTGLLLKKDNLPAHFSKLCANLSSSDQRKVTFSVLKLCSTQFLSSNFVNEESEWWKKDALSISAVAALISIMISGNEKIKSHLLTWLSGNFGAGVGEGISIRRSVIAAISNDKCFMENLLEKCLKQFGDHLYIRHTPTLQQEAHCQILLLTAGCVHRHSPLRIRIIVKSGANLSLVSNRLASSSNRARFLGMIVGEALSTLVDKDENRMDFKIAEMNNSEAKWYKSLIEVVDSVGTLCFLVSKEMARNVKKAAILEHEQTIRPMPLKLIEFKNLKIEEADHGGRELDGLDIYSKPDSDPDDSDDDPTLINRKKLSTPVYIRDLITYLRNIDSFDHQRLGLSTAASLIRRKANFGTEASDHAEELATLLVGIQDKYNIENFSDMRLAGMIALVVSFPSEMGKWFSNTFFEGDYSISQRSSILTALGLGAREVGGLGSYKNIERSNNSADALFPSEILPANLEKYYGSQESTLVDALSYRLERNMITPMVGSLADKLTGPTILKIRTFSSRMKVEKTRPKPSINKLSKIVGESFLFPLIGKFFIHSHSYMVSKRSIIFQPFLLSHFIKTLALILHAAGPSTPSLSEMTTEFWDLLLGLQVLGINERIVYEAVCFAILNLLELNSERSEMVQAYGHRLLDTQKWVNDIVCRLGDGDERCKMLGVGCMVKIQEIVEKYQKKLSGTL